VINHSQNCSIVRDTSQSATLTPAVRLYSSLRRATSAATPGFSSKRYASVLAPSALYPALMYAWVPFRALSERRDLVLHHRI
jgi:hypothetical protein